MTIEFYMVSFTQKSKRERKKHDEPRESNHVSIREFISNEVFDLVTGEMIFVSLE
jgi:hypothetical protein